LHGRRRKRKAPDTVHAGDDWPARMRRYRRALDVSQDELARRMGINRRELIRWERGEHRPYPRMLILWEQALGIPPPAPPEPEPMEPALVREIARWHAVWLWAQHRPAALPILVEWLERLYPEATAKDASRILEETKGMLERRERARRRAQLKENV